MVPRNIPGIRSRSLRSSSEMPGTRAHSHLSRALYSWQSLRRCSFFSQHGGFNFSLLHILFPVRTETASKSPSRRWRCSAFRSDAVLDLSTCNSCSDSNRPVPSLTDVDPTGGRRQGQGKHAMEWLSEKVAKRRAKWRHQRLCCTTWKNPLKARANKKMVQVVALRACRGALEWTSTSWMSSLFFFFLPFSILLCTSFVLENTSRLFTGKEVFLLTITCSLSANVTRLHWSSC